MSKKKDEKKTYINVRLDEDDKRALKLNKIFDGWGAQGRHAKVNKIVENLSLIYEMEHINALRSFLNIYKSSKDILAPLFDESEEELLYQALDDLFREAVQNSHVSIAANTFQVQAKYIALKNDKLNAEFHRQESSQVAIPPVQSSPITHEVLEQSAAQTQSQPLLSETIAQVETVEQVTSKNSSLDERRKSITASSPVELPGDLSMFDGMDGAFVD